MSDQVGVMSAEQLTILKEFRERLADVLQPHHDNRFLERFLRARKFDIPKAEAMLRKSLQWRKAMGADFILNTYKLPEVVSKYVPSSLLGFDKDGSSVHFLSQGHLDFKGLVSSLRRNELFDMLAYLFEYDLQAMKLNNKKTGRNADTFVYILDYEDFSIRSMANKLVMELFLDAVKMFEANYPETLKTAFLINVPLLFYTIYAAMKPFLAEETQKKVKFFGSDGWKEELLKSMDAEILPVFLGGTRVDSNGDPNCSQFINRGGTMPQSYYLSNQQCLSDCPDAIKVTIDYRDVHLVEIHVVEIKSFLEWEVQTQDSDIGIGLLYRNEASSSGEDGASSAEVELLPTEKHTCHLYSEKGDYICERPGYYILQLDNSFGRYRQKTNVSYRFKVTPIADNEEG